MDNISNIIKFERNENRPILDNHKVNDNDILNGCAESKLSAANSAAFLQKSPLTEKQVLTSLNNNFQNEKPNISVTDAGNSTGVISNNSGENISLSSEAGTTKAGNISCSSLEYEISTSIDTSDHVACKSLLKNSLCENEINYDSDTKSANISSNEIPVGNLNFPPDALSDEVCSDNQKNLSINAAHCNQTSLTKVENVDSTCSEEIKDEKNNSYVVVPDLVDFSFREQENIASDSLLSFTGIDSLSKTPEPSPNRILEEISAVNVQESKPLGVSAELLETDFVNRGSKIPTNILKETATNDTAESCDVLRHSLNVDSPLKVSENPIKEVINNVITSDSISTEFGKPIKAFEEVSAIDPGSTNNEYREMNSDETVVQVHENIFSNEPDEGSPFKFEISNKSPLKITENPIKEVISNVLTSDNIAMEFEKLSKAAEEVFAVDSGSTNNEYREVNSDESAFQVPENISSNKPDEVSPFKAEKVSFGMSDKSPLKISENPIKEVISNVITSDNISMEFEKPSKAAKEVSEVDSGSTNNEYREVNNDESAFQVPENISSNKPSEVSPFKVGEVSFGMSDKSLEELAGPDLEPKVPSNNSLGQFSDPDFAFKVPEVPSNNPLEQFSAFKVPEVPSSNSQEQFSNPHSAFKVPEAPSNNPLEQFPASDFAFKMPENPLTHEGDEQFVDATQFFKDPNSFQFLENIRTSTVQPGTTVPRSSLYVNFDPLHSKFQSNVPRQDNCALITAAVQENNASVRNSEMCSPEAVNKHLVDVTARESLGNILISFDSPKSSPSVDSKIPVEIPPPPKMFTEEEVQQKLKIHELETQDTYIKKQREMEMEIAKRDELLKFQRLVMEEFCGISVKLSDDFKKGQEKIMSLEAENVKLKDDLKTSAEDLQSVENTFTDFYKRYEQSKSMLKTYKDNEEHLKQTITDLQTKAKEQEQMYHMLQERTEEMLEKANVEVDNVKRSGEAQVTVLKAQLKKAEMKISSLESDIKQIKIENSQLGGICDDLMAKVSQS